MGFGDNAKKCALTKREITKRMREDLARSGLTQQDAKKLGYAPLTAKESGALGFQKAAGYLIPYFDRDGNEVSYCARVRFVEEIKLKGKLLRYSQTKNSIPLAYFPPNYKNWNRLLTKDAGTRLVITEGEKKAAKATKEGIPTIALGGVWSWRSAKRDIELLSELSNDVIWLNREVDLCFDNDFIYNDDVRAALIQLAKTLTKKGARVFHKRLPLDSRKIALDDFLVENSVDAYHALPREELTGSEVLWLLQDRLAWVEDVGAVFDTHSAKPSSFYRSAFSLNAATAIYNYTEDKKRVKAVDRWLEWGHRRTYSRLTYAPGEPALVGISDPKALQKSQMFNLWRGFAVEPMEGSVTPFLELFDFVFKEASDEFKRWALQWFAYPIQNPGTKLFSALVVIGGQGTGKTFLGQLISKIYGDNAVVIGEDQLHSQFNAWLANRQFILAEEVTGKHATRRDAERLKLLITSKQLVVNQKHAPTYEAEGVANFYFTSNRPDALHIEYNDRRYAVVETPTEGRAESFYRHLDKWQQNPDNIAALHYYLAEEVDCAAFNPNAPAPSSTAKVEMIRVGENPVEEWLSRVVENPTKHLMLTAKQATCELFEEAQLIAAMPEELDYWHRTHQRALRLALNARSDVAKRSQITIIEDGKEVKRTVYALRNAAKWKKRPPRLWAKHWHTHYALRPNKHRATVIKHPALKEQEGSAENE